MNALFLKSGDFAAIAAIDDVDLGVALNVPHETHAPRTQDAAVAVEHQCRTEVHVGFHALAVEGPTRQIHSTLLRSERIREILQWTLAAFVAHGTVERVIDEQKLEHT